MGENEGENGFCLVGKATHKKKIIGESNHKGQRKPFVHLFMHGYPSFSPQVAR